MEEEDIFRWVKFGKSDHILSHLTQIKAENRKFNYNRIDKLGRNMLHWACFCCQEQLFDWLLDNEHPNLNLRDLHGYSPIDLAILNREKKQNVQTTFVKKLLSKGATLTNNPLINEGPLHWAFYFQNLELIQIIIDANYQLMYDLTDNGLYPIDYLFFDLKPKEFKGKEELIFNCIVDKIFNIMGIPNPKAAFAERHRSPTKVKIKPRKHKSNNQDRVAEEPPVAYANHLYCIPKRPNFNSVVFSSSHIIESTDNQMKKRNKDHPDNEEPEAEEIRIKKPSSRLNLAFTQQLSNINIKTPSKQKNRKSYRVYQDEELYNKRKKSHLKFQLRLLYWSSHFDNVELVQFFLEKRCSPFVQSYQGQNPFQKAAQSGSKNVLALFLMSDFHSRAKKKIQENVKHGNRRKLDKIRLINQLTQDHPSTALHLAIEHEHYECAKLLVEYGASIKIVNYRNMQPFKLTSNQKVLKIYNDFIHKERQENFYEKGYIYVLQTKGKKNVSLDIVLIQLVNIRERFEDMGMVFEFNLIFGHTKDTIMNYKNKQECVPENFYYIIKIQPDSIYRLAEKYGFHLYHLRKKVLSQQFKYDEKMQFEFPKDLDIQQLILLSLNEEFDVEKFILEGLLIQHFPVQDDNKYNEMVEFWDEELGNCIRDTMIFKTDQKSLRPLHSMSQYYGPVIGWYFAFLVQLVAWLATPAIIGVGVILYCISTQQLDSLVFPFYGFLMVFWATFFLESWKRRENELCFAWDMHLFKKREQPRVMYQGQYILSSLDCKPEIFDKFTTFQRRLIMDGPVICSGISAVVACFLLIQYVQALYLEKEVSTFGTILFGSISGILMNILSSLYKSLVNQVVLWENHKFDSEYQFSYTLKLFLFEFINSYISLIYQTIFQKDRNKLAISVASITMTRGIIQNIKSNVLPYIQYKIRMKQKKKDFEHIKNFFYSTEHNDLKIDSLPPLSPKMDQNPPLIEEQEPKGRTSLKVLSDQQYLTNIPQLANQTFVTEHLNMTEQLEFLSQLQLRDYMSNQKHLIDEYTDLAIQFGYITMFATAFPPAPILFMINCYLNLRFSLFNYTNVIKREQAQPSESLGIWLNIFNIMSYSATIMNCIIIYITYSDKFEEVIGNGTEVRLLSILLIIEHCVLLVKYFIAEVIDDVPPWVQKELARCEEAERRTKQS